MTRGASPRLLDPNRQKLPAGPTRRQKEDKMTDVGHTVNFDDDSQDSKITQGFSTDKDLIIECEKDIVFKVKDKSNQVARMFYDASYGVQMELDGGLIWAVGGTPYAAGVYANSALTLKRFQTASEGDTDLILGSGGLNTNKAIRVHKDSGGSLGASDNVGFEIESTVYADIYYDSSSGSFFIRRGVSSGNVIEMSSGAVTLNRDLQIAANDSVEFGSDGSISLETATSKLWIESGGIP